MFTEDDVRALTVFTTEGHLLTSMYFHVPKIQTISHSKEQIALKDLFREARRRLNHRQLSKVQTESLEQDSQRMVEFLSGQSENGRRDQALFACSGRGFFKTVPLPKSPETNVFVRDSFYVRPLVALLDAHPRHCVVVADRETAQIYMVKMGEVERRASVQDSVPGRVRESGFGGYEERRIQRHADQELNRHYQHVVEEVQNLWKRQRFSRLLIAGHKETTAEFESLLPEEFRRRVAGRFVIDPHAATAEQVCRRALQVLQEHDQAAKERLVRQVLDNAGPRGRGVVGLDATLQALVKREVQTLLVSQAFSAGGKRCPNCGYLGGVTPAECPQCSTALQTVDDVIEYAINQAVREGSEVRFLTNNPDFERAGNIGAVLRYRSESHTG